jgi:tetrapyrrole methylase family protein/MazG family protein
MQLIADLRGEKGCPWDRKQTPQTLAVYLIEEVYELVEAIITDDPIAVREELGDVLFQIMFLIFLYQEQGRFNFEQILSQNIKKMIHRHPHVFGKDKVENADQVRQRWREIKQKEKESNDSILESVPSGMPALMRAYRISERAVAVGFDWENLEAVLAQAEAEWIEFKTEIEPSGSEINISKDRQEMEFGDILFTLVNVARIGGVHPETALIRATNKFISRFKKMEDFAAQKGIPLDKMQRDLLEQLWCDAKRAENLTGK